MLNQWKNKIKNIFQNDEHKTNHNKQTTFKKSKNIETKMTYHYPENKNFRFPMIPDEPIQKKNEKEKPAYLRRKTNEQPTRSKREPNHRTASTERRTIGKVYKRDDSPPFEPTDVPSPIYGYQKRKKEIENVPAYQRKQEKQAASQGVVRHETVQQEEPRKIEKTVSPEPIERIQPQKTQITEKAAKEQKTIKQREDNKQWKNHQRKTRSRQHNRKQSKTKTQTPYNVLRNPVEQHLEQFKNSQTDKRNEVTTNKRKGSARNEHHDKVTAEEKHIPLHLLDDVAPINHENTTWVIDQQHLLEQTLKHFNVAAKVVNSTQGPSVTRFEVQPDMGVKVSKIRNLSDDLKLNMSAKDIRIEAPIPGKNTVGIEVPNPEAQNVGLQEIFETITFENSKSPLTVALGLDIEGDAKITDIQKMPHGLIAGATGSGKSVCINSILISILYKASYEDVKFLLIDPKMVELAPYNGIPHLVAPVITDVKAATQSLKWAVNEMEKRYESFVEEGVRDIERFNRKVIHDNRKAEKMPYIVIVIDELADLMMIAPQDVENSISRIAQKARACGIHLLLATQRPSVDVITGLIKANVPTRIAFSVSSQVDSRTILDTGGAEKLLGKGDMLFSENGTGKTVRLQGPFVSDDEIERVTAHVREIAKPEYLFEQEQLLEQMNTEETEDELLEAAIEFVVHQHSASTSMLQRHFKIGYNRAARLIDTMEQRGIISGQNGSKPREILVTDY